MNALATITPDETLALALADDTPFPSWLALGRDLATRKRNIDWLIGDWIHFGREHYPGQIELALGEVTEDPRRLKRIEKTIAAFPPHKRDASLSFDHHAHVADLPTQEALPLLKQAHDEGWDARQTRIRAMLRKVATGQILPREDDAEDDAFMLLVRAWNRAPANVREDFAELVASSHLGVIDPSGRMK
ncbi:MAG: hypothetical protein V4696_01850 [Pseudomonadota bacterium]